MLIDTMSQEHRKILAKNVEKFRKAKNMTKEALSLALNFDNSYIPKLEKGNVNITIDRISTIAKFFDVEISELFK